LLAKLPVEIPIPLIPPAPAVGPLGVPYVPQCLGQWCWAACVSMVLKFYQQHIDQCQVAEFQFGGNRCCPCNILCNQPCEALDVAPMYCNWHVSAPIRQGGVSQQTLLTELQAGRPVELALGPCPDVGSTKSGHLVVVFGAASDTTFWVHDPQVEGSGPVQYSDLVTGMGRGCWCWTWTGIQPQPAASQEVDDGCNA
jgi:hypothetical protein